MVCASCQVGAGHGRFGLDNDWSLGYMCTLVNVCAHGLSQFLGHVQILCHDCTSGHPGLTLNDPCL